MYNVLISNTYASSISYRVSVTIETIDKKKFDNSMIHSSIISGEYTPISKPKTETKITF